MDAIIMIRMQSTPARLELPRNRGQLSIDQYPSRASYNMKTMLDTTRDDVQRGKQTAWATIGRSAADGDLVAAKKSTVAVQAVQAAESMPATVDYVSITRPDIRYQVNREPGDFQPGRIDVQV